jgi:hypothetical protein
MVGVYIGGQGESPPLVLEVFMPSRVANNSAEFYLRNQVPFRGSNFYGVDGSHGGGSDRWYLSGAALERWYKDQSAGKIHYSVWSYGTPIAWLVEGEGWVIPPVKYSMSTGRHQGYVRRAVAGQAIAAA